MNERLESAVEALQEELQTKLREVADTKKMINSLRRRMGQEALYVDVDVEEAVGPARHDMYYGKPLSTAARTYLERRKSACNAEEIMKGLEAGGFDFKAMGWKENDRLRVFALTLGKNSQTFHKLPNGTIGLLEWYPTVSNRKEKPEKDAEAEPEPEAKES